MAACLRRLRAGGAYPQLIGEGHSLGEEVAQLKFSGGRTPSTQAAQVPSVLYPPSSS
jgi:hypothetical protein